MVVGFVLLDKYPKAANRISEKFNKVWVFAEILLFVLVGAQVDVKVIKHSGLLGLLVLFIGLVARSIGVYISLMESNLNLKEKNILYNFIYAQSNSSSSVMGVQCHLHQG